LVAVAALGVVLVVGAMLRLHNVDYRTLNHPEVYTPGIDLPWHLSNPNPRFSLWQTLAGTIAGEPHPPGYYVVMLGWTKWFGSSIFSLRLPSVLFGVASIFLIYVLACHTEDTLTGLLAAAMLAGNGFHLYWSQTARMYSMGCFLALLSTVLLILIIKQPSRKRSYELLYVVFTVAGLATHVYFWPVFLTQVLWVLATSLRARCSLPGLLRLQIFISIVASPLVAIAAYQTGNSTRPLTLIPLEGVLRFLQFGSLLEIGPLTTSTAAAVAVTAISALLATAVLFASLVPRKRKDPTIGFQAIGNVQEYGAPRLVVTAAVGVLMALSTLVFAYFAKTLLPGRSTRLVIAASVLPLALMFIDVLLCNYWKRFKELWMILAKKNQWPGGLRSLNFFLAVLPVGIVAAISFFNPIFIQRGTLVFAPFLLIVLANGLANLMRRDRRWVAVAVILAIIHGFSVLHFKSKPSNPDYKALAESWVSRIEDSDLILVHGRGHPFDWKVAPIFYYLNAARYHFVGSDFANAIRNHPNSRVWVLSFPEVPTEKEVIDTLTDYRVHEHVQARNISARLYLAEAPLIDTSGGHEKVPSARTGRPYFHLRTASNYQCR